MVKRCEPLLNVVTESKPKVLRSFRKKLVGLGQNGKGTRLGAPNSPSADEVPPAVRWSLSHSKGPYSKRSKPVALSLITQ